MDVGRAEREAGDPPRVARGDAGTGVGSLERSEHVHAAALALARAALAEAIVAEPEGLATALRVLEAGVHRRRIARRAMLPKRPGTGWLESWIETIHAHAGFERHSDRTPRAVSTDIRRSLARLPWSGEWLIRVLATFSAPAAARVRPGAAAWEARRNAFVEDHLKLVAYVARRSGWGAPDNAEAGAYTVGDDGVIATRLESQSDQAIPPTRPTPTMMPPPGPSSASARPARRRGRRTAEPGQEPVLSFLDPAGPPTSSRSEPAGP
jgi:hypothetical protein